ncbi:hypothetical protein J4419_05435 [Candidatus Woesearchaeota archaeon]|nr:hypothetical protein [Candidatus Woesearchaeota archaeon]
MTFANARELTTAALGNHDYRRKHSLPTIPSEQSTSPLVALASALDQAGRYNEHRAQKERGLPGLAIRNHRRFYEDTDFATEAEIFVAERIQQSTGADGAEVRFISGTQANEGVYRTLYAMRNKDGKGAIRPLGYVFRLGMLNGGHLSHEAMGTLGPFLGRDTITERYMVDELVMQDGNRYLLDVPATIEAIERRMESPEGVSLVIFGGSLIPHPLANAGEVIAHFADRKDRPFFYLDGAHISAVWTPESNPFTQGFDAAMLTQHKVRFGTQRGFTVYQIRNELQERFAVAHSQAAFPGETSNHHLGTLVGAAYAELEWDMHQSAFVPRVLENARHYAAALAHLGMHVEGGRESGYTTGNQVVVYVGREKGEEMAAALRKSGITTNHQVLPGHDDGTQRPSGVRMGVGELTRFGFGKAEFAKLAELVYAVVVKDRSVREDARALRSGFTKMLYRLPDEAELCAEMIERFLV